MIPASTPTRSYGLRVVVAAHYDQAVEQTRTALQHQGFGVITEIDVKKTMQEKLNADFRPYLILGACNPSLAHRALSADLSVGLLLPCNVVVYDNGDGTSTVEALDPEAALGLMGGQPDVAAVAHEARERLLAMIRQLAEAEAARPSAPEYMQIRRKGTPPE